MTIYDRGREGVKNHQNLADVICTCPLMFNVATSSRIVIMFDVQVWDLLHGHKVQDDAAEVGPPLKETL